MKPSTTIKQLLKLPIRLNREEAERMILNNGYMTRGEMVLGKTRLGTCYHIYSPDRTQHMEQIIYDIDEDYYLVILNRFIDKACDLYGYNKLDYKG